MAQFTIQPHPFLLSHAQLYVMPVSSDGYLLDPILSRCKTLYPDNYQQYRTRCFDGTLMVGDCYLHTRQTQRSGLSASTNADLPRYIANLAVTDHPLHPVRQLWLNAALAKLAQQLFPLVRDDGLRRAALLVRPLLYRDYHLFDASAIEAEAIATDDTEVATSDFNPADLRLQPHGTIANDESGSTAESDIIQPLSPPDLQVPILQWQADILPMLEHHLSSLPRLTIDLHVPADLSASGS